MFFVNGVPALAGVNTSERSTAESASGSTAVQPDAAPAPTSTPTPEARDDQGMVQVQTSSAGVDFVTGGVGKEEMQSMAKHYSGYDLKLVNARKTGDAAFVVGVDISISQQGKTLVDTTTAGPWLWADVPAGSYQVQASFDGASQDAVIQVPNGGMVEPLILEWQVSPEEMQDPEVDTEEGDPDPVAANQVQQQSAASAQMPAPQQDESTMAADGHQAGQTGAGVAPSNSDNPQQMAPKSESSSQVSANAAQSEGAKFDQAMSMPAQDTTVPAETQSDTAGQGMDQHPDEAMATAGQSAPMQDGEQSKDANAKPSESDVLTPTYAVAGSTGEQGAGESGNDMASEQAPQAGATAGSAEPPASQAAPQKMDGQEKSAMAEDTQSEGEQTQPTTGGSATSEAMTQASQPVEDDSAGGAQPAANSPSETSAGKSSAGGSLAPSYVVPQAPLEPKRAKQQIRQQMKSKGSEK
ncbi:MAG: hypothetical protein L0H83_02075 [Salinisphaera sp.]|nr:hypothetical protein [Salinisphaera sp.]